MEQSHHSVSTKIVPAVQHEYRSDEVKRWARQCIINQSIGEPHWKNFMLMNFSMVSTPPTVWNLKLVNIQRWSRDHQWDLERLSTHHSADLSSLARLLPSTSANFSEPPKNPPPPNPPPPSLFASQRTATHTHTSGRRRNKPKPFSSKTVRNGFEVSESTPTLSVLEPPNSPTGF